MYTQELNHKCQIQAKKRLFTTVQNGTNTI